MVTNFQVVGVSLFNILSMVHKHVVLGSVLETLKFCSNDREDIEDAVHSTCSVKHLENIECSYYG